MDVKMLFDSEIKDTWIREVVIQEAALLRREIDAKIARLRILESFLVESVTFDNGELQPTCLIGARYKARIRPVNDITFDQEKLSSFRKYLPDEKFNSLFKLTFEPTSWKAIRNFLVEADPPLSDGLRWCMNTKPAGAHIVYEKLDSAGG